MLKLMKYEFRKTFFSKLILLAVTALAEILFLAGVFLEWDKGLAIGIVGLMLCAVIGIFYIGIESLLVFHKDLNTKQSYMLFLTPKNSYQILGSKVLENGISIFLSGAFFAALTAADVTIAVLYIGGIQEFLDLMKQLSFTWNVELHLSTEEFLMAFFSSLASWLMTIITGYLAIVLSATVLTGKKFSGFVSFVLFMVLTWLSSMLIDHIPSFENTSLRMWLIILAAMAVSAVMYVVSGWIMERKLSV